MNDLIRQGRDLRADLVRGLALWVILINHMPGNVLGEWTPKNIMLADATEAFVLLAGYAAGIAYGRLMERQGWLHAASRVVGRAGALYVAHIFLFVVFTAQVGLSAAALDQVAYLDELLLDPFRDDPYGALLQALLLTYQPSFLNILPLYIVLLLFFAAALPLLRWPWWLLGLSAALWAAARGLGLEPPSWSGDGWFFNPFAWQLLFFLGCVIGYAAPGASPVRLPWRRGLGLLAMAILAAGAVAVVLMFRFWAEAERDLAPALVGFLAGIDKTGLHPARLASVIAATYLFAHLVPASAQVLRARWAAPFLLIGQRALPVFCAGIALSFLGRLVLEQSDAWPSQVLVNLAGLAGLVGIGLLAAWYAEGGRAARLPGEPRTDTR
jgi:hypothetical protein